MLDPAPGMFTRGLTNAGIAAAFAALPLLHRFSPLAAPLVFLAFGYAIIFRSAYQFGTGGGGYMFYLTATALFVLLIGTEHVVLAALAGAIAAGLIILLHLVAPYNTGLVSPELQFWGNFVTSAVINTVLLFTVMFYAFRQVARAEAALEREYERSETLLQNLMPVSIAQRLKNDPQAIVADQFDQVTLLFADIVDFTPRAARLSPNEIVRFLNKVFSEFDRLAENHGLEKIKTIGDAYMVAGGMPELRDGHAAAVADMALDMLDVTKRVGAELGDDLSVRIGIHTGPAVAGVIGTRKIFYDVWGDTVNTASRMESHGLAGKIQVTKEAKRALGPGYVFERRGLIEVKGKGEMELYCLIGKSSG